VVAVLNDPHARFTRTARVILGSFRCYGCRRIQIAHRCDRPSLRALEADALMRAVAERFAGAAAATAKARTGQSADHAAGAADNFEIAANGERSVELRLDRERAIAHSRHVGAGAVQTRCGFAARMKRRGVVAAVAERLVLTRAATAQGGAVADRFAVEHE